LVFTVYVAANGLLGWRSLTETPPGNVIADAIHSRMFCAPRLTNAYHFSRHSYSAICRRSLRSAQLRPSLPVIAVGHPSPLRHGFPSIGAWAQAEGREQG